MADRIFRDREFSVRLLTGAIVLRQTTNGSSITHPPGGRENLGGIGLVRRGDGATQAGYFEAGLSFLAFFFSCFSFVVSFGLLLLFFLS